MKFCAKWTRDLKHEKDFDELIIKWEGIEQAPALVVFLKEHHLQRIIIDVLDAEKFMDQKGDRIFRDVLYKYDCENFTLRFPDWFNHSISPEFAKILTERRIPFYFNTVVSDFDVLYGMYGFGVSDILVGNNMGFSLRQIYSTIKHLDEVNGTETFIRVYPNVAQSEWADTPAIKQFFVRPEAAYQYGGGPDQCVDVFEFYQIDGNTRTDADTLYNIYAGSGSWAGPLSELILYFDKDIDNSGIIPDFDTARHHCQKRCHGGSAAAIPCHICDNVAMLANSMAEEGRIFIRQNRP